MHAYDSPAIVVVILVEPLLLGFFKIGQRDLVLRSHITTSRFCTRLAKHGTERNGTIFQNTVGVYGDSFFKPEVKRDAFFFFFINARMRVEKAFVLRIKLSFLNATLANTCPSSLTPPLPSRKNNDVGQEVRVLAGA